MCNDRSAQDLTSVDVVDYEECLNNFSKRMQAWDNAEEQVENLIDETVLQAEINAQAEHREHAMKAKRWNRAHPPQVDSGSASVKSSGAQNIKLPKLDLQKFGGETQVYAILAAV